MTTTNWTQGAAPKPAATDVEEGRSTEFKAVEGGQEQYSGATLLVEAYAAVWLVLMAFIFLLWRKQASLGARVEGLEGAIDRALAAAESAKRGKAKAEEKTA